MAEIKKSGDWTPLKPKTKEWMEGYDRIKWKKSYARIYAHPTKKEKPKNVD